MVKKVQSLLKKLGFDPGIIDGIWGQASEAALDMACEAYGIEKGQNKPAQSSAVSLEQYMQADGFYHIPKGINIHVSEHFRSGEFDCQCKRPECKWTIIHPKLLIACEDLRADVGGRPLTITDSGGSGYRCPAHNADPDVGGAPNSLHTLGLAADIHCIGVNPAQLAATAERRKNYGEIGIYPWGIHLGVFRPDGNHTRW